MQDVIGQLQQLGFGEYEARAYMALLRRSPLNGYEVAKASGLPRANVYSVLDKLQARGAVVRLDTPEGVRYSPVPPAELMQRLSGHFQQALDSAQHSLEELAQPGQQPYIWNSRGYPALLEHAHSMLDAAHKTLLVATWPEESHALAPGLARATARGVQVTTLCLNACQQECGGCRGSIYRREVAPGERGRWLVLVPDGSELLAGEIGPGEDVLAVRTSQPMLIDLASWYIRHSIALSAVLSDLGLRLDEMLKPETRQVLESLGPVGQPGGWLEYMHLLLHQTREQGA